jgi:hypothetical protein
MATLEENQKKYPHDPDAWIRGYKGKDWWLEHDLKIEEITLAQEQRASLADQKQYTEAIKTATVWMARGTVVLAIATLVQIAFQIAHWLIK